MSCGFWTLTRQPMTTGYLKKLWPTCNRTGAAKKITKVFDEQLGRDITECIFYIHSTWRDNGYLPAGQRKV